MLPAHVLGRWLYSHDEDGVRVYRPRGEAFAPGRRPRDGFDIEADGAFRSYAAGSADAPIATEGRWRLAEPDRLEVIAAEGTVTRTLEIVEAAPGMLKVRTG